MSIRLITTVGGAYSNSYVTIKEADTFAINFPWYTDTVDASGNVLKGWSTFSEDEQRQALIQAAFSMDGLPWTGAKCKPAVDAGKPAEDWDKYLINGVIRTAGIFDYFDDGGAYDGGGQGEQSIKYGIEDSTLFEQTTEIQIVDTRGQGIRFWQADGTELVPTTETSTPSPISQFTFTHKFVWNTAVDIAYITAKYEELIDPFATAIWNWGFYVNNKQLLNFPGTTADQAQRMAWPRSGVTCQGETANCTFIPQTIKNAQVLIAYNFLIKPYLVPGTPGLPPSAPEGTYVKRQKLDVLEIEYQQYQGFDPTADPCVDKCNDPYLYQVFDWLSDLLGCWATSKGSNREVRLYRN